MRLRPVQTLATSFNRLRLDLRDALRSLQAGKWTTLTAFVVLALTMGAGTVTYSVVSAVALQPLPYGSPDRLVSISLPSPRPGSVLPASPQDYVDWRDGTRTFEGIGAARFAPALTLEVDGSTVTLAARRITANLFDVLGVRPAAGRFFGPNHERPGAPGAVILSFDLWTRRFGSDRGVIGRPLLLGGDTHEVVGVLPPGVAYPIRSGVLPDIYLPLVMTAAHLSNNRTTSMVVVGRLRPGVSVELARADVERISSAVVQPLHEQVVGPARTWLVLLLAGVWLVLIVACINVASLFLARAATRTQEFATREALGASRGRLVSGLLLEGLVLAGAAAATGVGLSFWGVDVARANLPPGLARTADIAVNGDVLSVSIAAAVLSGLVFASAPAWLTARSSLSGLMKEGSGPIVGSRRSDRLLTAFLVTDVAFVSVLLVATTLVVTSFVAIVTADLGFDRHNVVRFEYHRSMKGVADDAQPATVAAFRADLLERAARVPGVTDVALSTVGGTPLSGSRSGRRLVIPGFGVTTDEHMPLAFSVTPGYFRAVGMHLIRGRPFGASDRAGTPRVMLINDVAARVYFAARDPIGQVITDRYPSPDESPFTIIGVLKGIHVNGPEADVRPEVYTLLDQERFFAPYVRDMGARAAVGDLVVRTARNPRELAGAIREAIRPALGGDPQQTLFVDDDFRRLTAVRRFNAGVMAVFGLIAVALGAVGVYGTMSFVVAQQVRSIGLRMALGATPARVLRSVLLKALRHVALGMAIGLAGAWLGSGVFTSFVFGIQPTEPSVYLAVGAFLGVVGLAAAFVPGLRASRLDPLVALRRE